MMEPLQGRHNGMLTEPDSSQDRLKACPFKADYSHCEIALKSSVGMTALEKS